MSSTRYSDIWSGISGKSRKRQRFEEKGETSVLPYTSTPRLWFWPQLFDHYCIVKGHPYSHLITTTYVSLLDFWQTLATFELSEILKRHLDLSTTQYAHLWRVCTSSGITVESDTPQNLSGKCFRVIYRAHHHLAVWGRWLIPLLPLIGDITAKP